MKVMVVFSSKTGNTEKYAKWIAEELGTEAVPANNVRIKDLKDYETIIYGGGLYAERINGIKFIKKNLKKLGIKISAPFEHKITEHLKSAQIKMELVVTRKGYLNMTQKDTYINERGWESFTAREKKKLEEYLKQMVTKLVVINPLHKKIELINVQSEAMQAKMGLQIAASNK